MAAASIANIVKSSLGPVGLDKMLVDDIGVSITFVFTGEKRNERLQKQDGIHARVLLTLKLSFMLLFLLRYTILLDFQQVLLRKY